MPLGKGDFRCRVDASNFLGTNCRCQRRVVSGVTKLAIFSSASLRIFLEDDQRDPPFVGRFGTTASPRWENAFFGREVLDLGPGLLIYLIMTCAAGPD